MKKKRAHNEHGPSHVTPAGRGVFYDLGFDEAEARVLEMRALEPVPSATRTAADPRISVSSATACGHQQEQPPDERRRYVRATPTVLAGASCMIKHP